MYEIDNIDRRIIRALQKDGRASNVDVARQVGVTEGTVRKRLERLVDNDVIRIAALAEPAKIGYPTHTLIGLQVEMAVLDSVIEQLVGMPEICSVFYVTGEYDLMVEALFAHTNELLRFLADRIGRIEGIRKSSTSHILRVVKAPCDWEVPHDHMAQILIVDDDSDFVEYTRSVLEAEGYRVSCSTSGDDALAHMRIIKPDLVLMDVMMQSVLDGLHTSRAMRSDKDLGQIPIIMISSIADSQFAGMFPTDDYVPISNFLTKPVDVQTLLSEVRRLVRPA